jgi:hypothetical protein
MQGVGSGSSGSALWWITKDGDDRARALFDRHYSRYRYKDGRQPKLFCGPGEKLVLSTWEGDALWVWRKFIDASGQRGINCAIFRNESPHKASELVRQADAIADHCWPRERHYTYVDARRIRSNNPGCCFKVAGWREAGRTKGGLVILERNPPNNPDLPTSANGESK